MGWTPNAFSIAVLFGAAVSAGVGVAALRERPDPMARPIAALMGSIVFWSVPQGLSFGFDAHGVAAGLVLLSAPAGMVAPIAFFALALRYAGHEQWLTRRTYALLLSPAVVLAAITWTNAYHGLFWRSTEVASVGAATTVLTDTGPAFVLVVGYGYLLTALGLVVLAHVAVRSGPIYRLQSTLLFLAVLLPLSTNVAFQLGWLPVPAVDVTTLALTVTGLAFALVLFRFDLLEIQPVARERLVESLEDAVVVIGPNQRVRDYNGTADRLLDGVETGQPAPDALPESELSDGELPDGGELTLDDGDDVSRTFRTRSTPLEDGSGRRIGRIVYFNDVTDAVRREQRLSVLNRVLRHNVRNELTVALGSLESVEGSDADSAAIATARESLERVVATADKARSIEQTLRRGHESSIVDVRRVADDVASVARERFPHAEIHADEPDPRGRAFDAPTADATDLVDDTDAANAVGAPTADAADAADTDAVDATGADGADAADPGIPVEVRDELLLERSLWELVENGVVHNDGAEPAVTIAIEVADGGASVRVSDDGDGVPETEQRVLRSDSESPLEHGSGLGLWLVQWTASLSGGELRFEDGGSTVVLALPVADSTPTGSGDGDVRTADRRASDD